MLMNTTKSGDFYATYGGVPMADLMDESGIPHRAPQKSPGPPDQSSRSDIQEVIWSYDEAGDHNAGAATRSATMIRIEPLPPGTTDIDTLEAGWDYVDS